VQNLTAEGREEFDATLYAHPGDDDLFGRVMAAPDEDMEEVG
jgi:hypothetical protein